MRPFLLLSIRAEEAAAVDEHDAFRRATGLADRDLHRVRLAETGLGRVSLDDWSGILLGGGAFNASDPESAKSEVQRRIEGELSELLDDVVASDFPFLGACYGIGVLGTHQGGDVDREHPEPVGPLSVTLTDAGVDDPVFAGVPREFAAYGGHKEAMGRLPDGAVLLAESAACPVQAFRVGRNVYATQFHPELDLAGICTRIDVYRNAGYFEPDQAEVLQRLAADVEVTHPVRLLRNFVELHAR
jgi:GMP synthase (glutamine-hydrolysing)